MTLSISVYLDLQLKKFSEYFAAVKCQRCSNEPVSSYVEGFSRRYSGRWAIFIFPDKYSSDILSTNEWTETFDRVIDEKNNCELQSHSEVNEAV